MSYRPDPLIAGDIDAYLARHAQKSLLRFITCGSVDDGKSTLIGRLLYDTKMIFEDQLDALAADSKRMGTQGQDIDFALLVDGLAAEREQGITIDVAYRFFTTDKRKFIVADCPGHEQYTRNMVTGASTADVAVILVDARKGVLTQTRRHTTLAELVGIRDIVLAVNKLDLIGFDRDRYAAICDEYRGFARQLGLDDTRITAIPISGLGGDNIASRSERTPWYAGPTLIEHLESVVVDDRAASAPFRLPVQWVNRPHLDFRGFAGTVASGRVSVGDAVRVLPSGRMTTVSRIIAAPSSPLPLAGGAAQSSPLPLAGGAAQSSPLPLAGGAGGGPEANGRRTDAPTPDPSREREGDIDVAVAGQAVTLTLADEVDCARGDVIAAAAAPPEVADQFEATIVWMADEAMVPGRALWLKLGTQNVSASVAAPDHVLNVNTLEKLAAKTLELNAIGVATVTTDRPLVFAPYAEDRTLGGFILIDKLSNATVAAGMLIRPMRRAQNIHWQAIEISREAHAQQKGQAPRLLWFTGLSGSGKSTIANLVEKKLHALGRHSFLLDGDNVRHGLNRDLGFSAADRVENIRRVGEVAKLMTDAGLIVLTAFISPFRAEREMVRALMPAGEFLEIFIDTPLDVAEARDAKGLYKKARAGELKDFTGIDSPYEAPERPEIRIDTTRMTPEAAAEMIVERVVGVWSPDL